MEGILSQTEKDVQHLIQFIQELGQKNNQHQWMITFGELVRHDKVANTLESLFGTLKAARKRKLIHFDGELLLQGVHDQQVITLIQ